jgi:hypothetical protein
MQTRIAILLTLLLPAIADASPTTQPAGEWKTLFNGKDLSGWYTYLKGPGKDNDSTHVFQVDDGMIHIYKDAEQGSTQPMGYIATNDALGDCRIRLEYKWGTKRFGSRADSRRDSGLLYFFAGADGAFGKGPWPYSVEFQIQENDVGDIYCVGTQVTCTIDPEKKNDKQPTYKEGGDPYTSPPTGNNRIIRSQMLEHDGWNTLELILDGDSATQMVNGTVNMRISGAKAPSLANPGELVSVKKGKILLQAEGAEVWYRNIEVQPLKR